MSNLRNNTLDSTLSINLVDLYEDDTNKIDYIIHFEDVATDLKLIPEFADRTDTDLFSEAQEVAALYRDYYDDETKAEVESVYSKDIARYGYTF